MMKKQRASYRKLFAVLAKSDGGNLLVNRHKVVYNYMSCISDFIAPVGCEEYALTFYDRNSCKKVDVGLLHDCVMRQFADHVNAWGRSADGKYYCKYFKGILTWNFTFQ